MELEEKKPFIFPLFHHQQLNFLSLSHFKTTPSADEIWAISQHAFIVLLPGPNFPLPFSPNNAAWCGAYTYQKPHLDLMRAGAANKPTAFPLWRKTDFHARKGRILFPLSHHQNGNFLIQKLYIDAHKSAFVLISWPGSTLGGGVHYTKASQRKNECFVSALTRRRSQQLFALAAECVTFYRTASLFEWASAACANK